MKYFPFRAISFGIHISFLIVLLYNLQHRFTYETNKVDRQPYDLRPDSNFAVFSLQEPYTNPLASISCWHVHCEECWLRTLVSYCRNVYTPSLIFRAPTH